MNHNFGPTEDELWREFSAPGTSWERKAELLVELAMKASSNRNFSRERTYLLSCLDISKEHGLPEMAKKVTDLIAHRAVRAWDDPDLTFATVDEVLAEHPGLVPDDDVIEHLASMRCAKASAYMYQERWAEAAYEYNIVLEMALMIEDENEQGHAHSNLVNIYIELDELDKAKEHGLKGKEIWQEQHQMGYQCAIDRQLARIEVLKGNYIRAKIELRQLRAIEQQMFGSSHPETKMFLGMAYMGLEEFAKAEKLFAKLFDMNTKVWNFAFDYSLQVGALLAESLQAQGKTKDADRVSFLLDAIAAKAPGVKRTSIELRQEEIKGLIKAGRFEEAEHVAWILLEETSEAGDLRGHCVGLKEIIFTRWCNKNYEGVVEIWDQMSSESLNYQDDLVIKVKNLVSHAFYKVGRVQEAKCLISEVLNDYRLSQSDSEVNYANENAAKIFRTLKEHSKANKYKERSLEGYIKIGDNERALEVMRYFSNKK